MSERAIVVGITTLRQNRWQVNDYLDELELLADTAGAVVLERVIQDRKKFDPAFMVGRGKAAELAQMAKYLDIDLIVFDDDSTAAQVKNIEEICKVKILDRSGLILDIFAKHARTKEARTQVELAQLQYLLPRLTRQWTHLSRQVGGIGVRGPGETQLEIDRRLIRKRIAVLQNELEKIENQRTTRRKRRNNVFKVALVGYTNVGKSTLLNILTDAKVLVEDQLFATLDPTIRAFEFNDSERVLLIDTVGFIRKLPHHLVASFKSTLEEAADADLLLHVIDISHPSFEDQIKAVRDVLSDLDLNEIPTVDIYNKIDQLEDESIITRIRNKDHESLFVSAQKGMFLNELENLLLRYFRKSFQSVELSIPLDRSDILSKLYDIAAIQSVVYTETTIEIKLLANAGAVDRINLLKHRSLLRD